MAEKDPYNKIQKRYLAAVVGRDAVNATGLAAAGLKLNDIQRQYLGKEAPLTRSGNAVAPITADRALSLRPDRKLTLYPEKTGTAGDPGVKMSRPALFANQTGSQRSGVPAARTDGTYPTLYADLLEKLRPKATGEAAAADKPFRTLYADYLQKQGAVGSVNKPT